ncbi:MAG: hypothetical protein L6Q38_11735 [Nitrospira sp.]|nr:hypothetical protein [Nitrospira sp.]
MIRISQRDFLVTAGHEVHRCLLLPLLLSLLLLCRALPAKAERPTIRYHSREKSVVLHQRAAFGVIASGTAPLHYQWCKDHSPVPGVANVRSSLLTPDSRIQVVIGCSFPTEKALPPATTLG